MRQEILDAASRLFVEEGFERVTMRRIAAQIEYSPTTIYLHFKDKDELLRAVCDETFSQLAAKLERLQRMSGTPLGYLREGLRTYVDFGLANPNQYTVTFLRPSPADSGAGGAGGGFEASIGGRAFDLLRQGVGACVESGDIRTASVDMTAQALWAGVHGLTALFITAADFPFVGRAALIDHTIDTMIAGLRAPLAASRTPVQPKSKKWDFLD
ncbi:MAG: TetR/AcrR family transcriptional regulator [Vicinamibacterales bacterium]